MHRSVLWALAVIVSAADTTPPSAPTGLVGSAFSASQVNLVWTASTDNVGVTGYRVYRNGTQVGTPTARGYSDPGLAASSAYAYTITAVTTLAVAPVPVAAHIAPPYTRVTDYYVAKNGNDASNGTSPATAWLTITHAVAALAAAGGTHGGVCVNVGDGTYDENIYASGLGGSADSPTGYLVFRSQNLHGATVRVPAANAAGANACFRFDAARFIVIDGFDLVGQVVAGSNESGVVCNSYGAPGHHITVINNRIHDHGGAGVGAVHTDYLVVAGNVIWNTSGTSTYQVSGISSWQAVASDGVAGFHNVIRDNIVFNNAEANDGHETHSDGNGIIIDDFRNTQNGSAYGVYAPATLVENNLAYRNGGRGIHVFLSDHVTVRNNTSVGNFLDPRIDGTWRDEIDAINSRSTIVVDNIAVAMSAANITAGVTQTVAFLDASTDGSNLGNVWRSNLSFNGTAGQASTMISGSPSTITAANGNILGADPLFTDPANRDFTLRAGSPAIAAGTTAYGAPSDDLAGNPRSGALDLGAFRYLAAATPPTVATPASGPSAPVTGTTASLGVLGGPPGSEAGYTYTWSVAGAPAGGGATFSPNGTHAARNATATFTAVGIYQVQVTITDPGSGTSTISGPVTVTVSPTLTSIVVSGPTVGVVGATLQFTAQARDQFAAALVSQPTLTWTTTGGTVSHAGLVSAGPAAGAFQVTAAAGGMTGSATFTLSASGGGGASSDGGSGGNGCGAGGALGLLALALGLHRRRS